ncbi:hypothetical protein [Pseudomonas atacamensis]|jgi:hypothetical protein|uniref:hypothetical protein n=1 Tax=Pseudomonas atacamensis TaxID=2565368 RepID=UPI00382D6620
MSQDKTSDLMNKRNATGSFVAFLDDDKFLESKLCVYAETETEFIIIGTDDFKHTVDLSVPNSLEADGPHTVTFPTTGRHWRVMINGFNESIVEGEVIVTFANFRKNVTGTFALDLGKTRKVTGTFNLALGTQGEVTGECSLYE